MGPPNLPKGLTRSAVGSVRDHRPEPLAEGPGVHLRTLWFGPLLFIAIPVAAIALVIGFVALSR